MTVPVLFWFYFYFRCFLIRACDDRFRQALDQRWLSFLLVRCFALWSKVLSTHSSLHNRYADADAEVHPDYDRYTAAHNELIVSRAQARLRKFNARTLGAKRPTATCTGQRHSLVPGCAPASQIVLDDADELDPLQWEGGFMEKRAALIEHFNIAWNSNHVAWLPYPGTGQSSACSCYCIYSCACAWLRHRCPSQPQLTLAQARPDPSAGTSCCCCCLLKNKWTTTTTTTRDWMKASHFIWWHNYVPWVRFANRNKWKKMKETRKRMSSHIIHFMMV